MKIILIAEKWFDGIDVCDPRFEIAFDRYRELWRNYAELWLLKQKPVQHTLF